MKFENVGFSYEDNCQIIKKIDFTLNKGEKIALMGASGSGKTTILRLICGLLLPSSGKVIINGEEIGNQIVKKAEHG